MNRQKKIKQLLTAHAKKASAKLAPRNKPRYISKADRLKMEESGVNDPRGDDAESTVIEPI